MICVFFYVYFGIAFGRTPQAFWGIWGSFHGAVWGHVAYFFADVAKLKKCNLFKPKACIIFANLLNVSFMLLSRRHSCAILIDLGLKGDACFRHFSEISQIVYEKGILEFWFKRC